MKKGHRTTLIVVDALFSLYDIAMVLKDKLQLLLIMQTGVKSPMTATLKSVIICQCLNNEKMGA